METREGEYNIGLVILRMYLCFSVVLYHFYGEIPNHAFFYWGGNCAVPVFMMLSFILRKQVSNVSELKKRINRLLIPQVGWTVIYFVLYYAFGVYSHFRSGQNIDLSIFDFLWQLFLGHSGKLNPTMWFQISLIVITFLIGMIEVYFPRQCEYILIVLTTAAIGIEYSGLLDKCDLWRYELKYPFVRLVFMVPFALTGYFVSKYKLLEKVKLKHLPLVCAILWLSVRYPLFGPPPMITVGFGYATINMITPLSAILFTWLLPLKRLPSKMKRTIMFVGRYTLGIYCCHRLVMSVLIILSSTLLRKFGIKICENDGFMMSTICFAFSFLLCFLLDLIPNTFIRKMVK